MSLHYNKSEINVIFLIGKNTKIKTWFETEIDILFVIHLCQSRDRYN